MSNDNYSSSGPPNSGYVYKRFGSDINEDYIPEESSPSFPAGGMNSFPPQEYQYDAREVQTGLVESYDSTGPGSMTDLRPVQPSLNNMDNRNSVLGTTGEAPTNEGSAHNIGSKIELGSEAEYGDKKAPGHSGLVHENHSKPSGGEASSADDESNQAEYFGMSLVAKKFKEVYRNSYYVEKDDDLNQSM